MAKFGQLTMSVGQLPSDHHADLRNGGSLGGRSEGLEPPTPCLQSMAKVSKTVRGLARSAPRVHLGTATSKTVGVSCGCHHGPLKSKAIHVLQAHQVGG